VTPDEETTMATTHTTIKLGTVVYLAGGVGGYPPARWRVTGVTGGGCVDLAHVKHPSAERGFPPQRVTRGLIERAIARGDAE
jgi:hypothetical protein